MNWDGYKIPRMLMVNDTVPPFVSGSSTLTFNLLQGLDTKGSVLIGQSKKGFSMVKGAGIDETVKLSIPTVLVNGIPKIFERGHQYGLPHFALLFQIPSIVLKGYRQGRKLGVEVVYTNWPSTSFAIAGWITAKLLRLPVVFYFHDLWYETQRNRVQKAIARIFEPILIKGSSVVLAMNPPSAEFIWKKYKVKAGVLEHAVNSEIWPSDLPLKIKKTGQKQILMLGAVNKYNLDSVVSFSKAMKSFSDFRLKILTNQSISDLASLGLATDKLETEFVSREQLKEAILAADLLYMALGFETPVQKEVEVVIPTRLMDYLPSGIPIIAHGPSNCWTLKEAKSRAWGFCVNSKEVEVIVKDLQNLLQKVDLSALVENAKLEASRRDYKNQSKLLSDFLISALPKEKQINFDERSS